MQISYLFRDGIGAAELRQTGSKKMHVLQLDVTNQEDWSKVKQYIEKNIPTTANGNIFFGKLYGINKFSALKAFLIVFIPEFLSHT